MIYFMNAAGLAVSADDPLVGGVCLFGREENNIAV